MDDAEVVSEYRGVIISSWRIRCVTCHRERQAKDPEGIESLQTFSSAEVNSVSKADAEKSMVELQTVRSTAAVSYAG